MSPLKIAIIGATRGIGLALTQQALADNHNVTALVRMPSRMPINDPKLRIIEGDALDPGSVAKAIECQDVVCICLGTKNVTKKVTFLSRSTKIISEVLKPEQLLITVTGLGAGDSKGHCGFLYDHFFLPVVLRRQYDDKDRQEDIIKNKIARWIIVRPGFLNNGPKTGRYRALVNLKGIHGGSISRADVADFILTQAKSPGYIGQTPMLIY